MDTSKSFTKHHPTEGRDVVWLTPPHILEALGGFELDPCAAPEPRPWNTALHHIALPDDGLTAEWFGRVWCNPPYGNQMWNWLAKLAEHGKGTALIFARTETAGFHTEVWGKATAILFLKGRLSFHHRDGSKAKANGGAPSCLVAYGMNDALRLKRSGLPGYFVWVQRHEEQVGA